MYQRYQLGFPSNQPVLTLGPRANIIDVFGCYLMMLAWDRLVKKLHDVEMIYIFYRLFKHCFEEMKMI